MYLSSYAWSVHLLNAFNPMSCPFYDRYSYLFVMEDIYSLFLSYDICYLLKISGIKSKYIIIKLLMKMKNEIEKCLFFNSHEFNTIIW